MVYPNYAREDVHKKYHLYHRKHRNIKNVKQVTKRRSINKQWKHKIKQKSRLQSVFHRSINIIKREKREKTSECKHQSFNEITIKY